MHQSFIEQNIITGVRKEYNTKVYPKLIDFLQDVYPSGFDENVTIFVNSKQVYPENYDIELEENAKVVIIFRPGWAAAGMFAAKLAIGLAVGYGLQKLFGTKNANLPTTPNYKNNTPSPTYNLNNSQNTIMFGNPIPSSYGTIKTYPPLLSEPYYRYENNEQYMYSLMTFGHGLFNIEDIYVGDSNISTLNSGDITYKKITPPNYINECDLRSYIGDSNYHQQVFTSPEVSNLELLPGRDLHIERFRIQDNTLYFYRGTNGAWPSTNFSIGDTLKFNVGVNGLGIQNNVGEHTVTAVDTINHTLSFSSLVEEAYSDIFNTKTAEFKANSVISSTGNIITIQTNIFSPITFKEDFKIGQKLNIDGSLKTITNVVYSETTSSSTLELTVDSLSSTPIVIKSNDVIGEFETQNSYGYYRTNPEGTNAKYIELDVVFPNGLYRSDTLGNLLTRKVEFQTIIKDKKGVESIHNFSIVDATVTSVRKTIVISVDDLSFGSYSIKLTRLTAKATDNTTSDRMFIERLKAPIIMERDNEWDDMTLLWVKAKATDAISSAGQFKINARITRTDVGNTIADVIKDLYSNPVYGAGLDVNDIIIPNTPELFNGSFETKIPVLEAMKSVGEAGRYLVTPKNGSIIVRKDTVKTVPTALFNETNILPNSLEVNYEFGYNTDGNDSVEVEYRDPITFESKVVKYPSIGTNPNRITLFGVTDKDVALKEAQYLFKSNNRKILYKFTTGIQGIIPEYMDKIMIGHTSIDAGVPGIVEYVEGNNVYFGEVEQKDKVSFIDEQFVVHGPYDISAWNNGEATVSNKPSFVTSNTRCHLFNLETDVDYALVTKISPRSQEEVEIEAISYDESVYEYVPESELVYTSSSDCGFDGFGYMYSPTETYQIGDIVVCDDRTQYRAIAISTGELPCTGTNPNWEVVLPSDPDYKDGVSTTPKMPGETDNGSTVEAPGTQQPEAPSVNWATIAGVTALGGLLAWGAGELVDMFFSDEEDCEDGYEWDPIQKACVPVGEIGRYGRGTDWNNAITYRFGDIVSFVEKVWISTNDSNLGILPGNTGDWVEIQGGSSGGTPSGLWLSTLTYKVGDIVSYNNIVYVSLTDNNKDNSPDTEDTHWQVAIGEKGEPGVGTSDEIGGILWDSTVDYVVGDVVSTVTYCSPTYKVLNVWVCKSNNTNKDPFDSSNGTYWKNLSWYKETCPIDQPDPGLEEPTTSCRPTPDYSGPVSTPPSATPKPTPSSPVTPSPVTPSLDPCFNRNTSDLAYSDPSEIEVANGTANAVKPGNLDTPEARKPENRPTCGIGYVYNKDLNKCVPL